MLLFLVTFGSFLHVRDGLITVKIGEKGEEKRFSPKKIESIFITSGAAISTDVISLCYENNIDIVFLNKFGDPISRVWHSKLGSTTLIRKKQLEISTGETGTKYARYFINKKFENQLEWIEKLIKTRPNHKNILQNLQETIIKHKNSLNEVNGTIEEIRNTLLGIEGSVGREYFKTISQLLPESFQFEERSRNPAKDEFNAALNYHYGILYSLVEKACILAGIDPFIGIMHVDNYNKKSFVFDAIEMVRIYAEESTLYLFSNRKLGKKDFQKLQNGVLIEDNGKKTIIEHFTAFLDEPIRYRGRNIKRKHMPLFELRHLANEWLQNEREQFEKLEIEEV
ncbi:CRISPR-associated endonuclease Cas1 [Thermospira aquatica]|uniref:CRISPR-associated endonuclease Cas1 n=1 Tax=Thermospira aquatica TaxID=2828656 RepID=A0AAX3BFY3_9SPIR|nr:CRISPR-associated endonuclease Cas1 [Thermospira aquatica]URA11171.1 CRISPR-associated endonuclease Cas1 [Thermospira aquatica]